MFHISGGKEKNFFLVVVELFNLVFFINKEEEDEKGREFAIIAFGIHF